MLHDVCSDVHQSMQREGQSLLMDEYRTTSLTTRYFSDLFTDDTELSLRSRARKESRKSVDDQCMTEYENEELPAPKSFIRRKDDKFDPEKCEKCGALVASLFPTSSKVRAVVTLKSPHTILSVSDSFGKWLGYTPQELVGRSLKVLSGPRTDTLALHAAIKNAALLNFECIEATIYASSGVGHHVLASCFPFLDEDGTLLGCSLEIKQLTCDMANNPQALIPFAPRAEPEVARRRTYNYRMGLALHREHAAPAGGDGNADILDQLLAAVQTPTD